MYCKECGKKINDKAVICPECGCKVKNSINLEKNKWVALLLWFFLGGFGVHRFYVKDISGGVIYILCLLFSWLIFPALILFALWIIDLIKILDGNLKGIELEG